MKSLTSVAKSSAFVLEAQDYVTPAEVFVPEALSSDPAEQAYVITALDFVPEELDCVPEEELTMPQADESISVTIAFINQEFNSAAKLVSKRNFLENIRILYYIYSREHIYLNFGGRYAVKAFD
jgi:hypothetical protein